MLLSIREYWKPQPERPYEVTRTHRVRLSFNKQLLNYLLVLFRYVARALVLLCKKVSRERWDVGEALYSSIEITRVPEVPKTSHPLREYTLFFYK